MGKFNQITSSFEIDRTVQEVDKFRAEGASNRPRIEAKSEFESYCFTMCNTFSEIVQGW